MRKGFALISVLIVLAILMVFVAAIFQLTLSRQDFQRTDWKKEKATYIAEAGLIKGTILLEEWSEKKKPVELNNIERGYSFSEPYDGGKFVVQFEYVPITQRINGAPWKISSTGHFQGRKTTETTMWNGYDPLRKIVVFAKSSPQIMWKEIGTRHGTVLQTIPLINAAVVVLNSSEDKNQLIMETGVVGVDNDERVAAMTVDRLARKKIRPEGKNSTIKSTQGIPWGIGRINAPSAWSKSTALNIKVAIIDTGIITNHPDLMLAGGINIISPTSSYADDNGHGTHVAGTVAALNNLTGVVGGGHQASLYAVKALDKNGSGYVSDVISGLNWALNNGIKVANLSLGTTVDVLSLHDAIINATKAGMTVVAAAGNAYGGAVVYPAKYPETIAVSASTETDTLASFSSIGPEVDFIAPGANIFSTYHMGCLSRKTCIWYNWMSGTSMAAPHVTASVALRLAQTPVATPDQIRQALQSSAALLPGLTTDQQGSGFINSYTLVNLP